MEVSAFIIMVGVCLIDGKLWKIMKAQRDHQKKVESLLTEIRDKTGAR